MKPDPADVTETFVVAWVAMCKRLEIHPVDLLRVAYSESAGLHPWAHNPNGHASGLIQFMPNTLMGLGWSHGHEAFRQLTAEEQVPFVEAYMRPKAPWCHSDALCYVAVFLPGLLPAAALAADRGAAFILCGAKGPMPWAYKANTILDHDKDGLITVADLAKQLDLACKGARYDAIAHRVRMALGEPSTVPPEPPSTEKDLPAQEDDGGASRREAVSESVAEAAEEAVTERAKGEPTG